MQRELKDCEKEVLLMLIDVLLQWLFINVRATYSRCMVLTLYMEHL